MKKLYIDLNNVKNINSPLCDGKQVIYKAYDKKQHNLKEYISIDEYNNLLVVITKAMRMNDLIELKALLSIEMTFLANKENYEY